jgi:bacillithiol biosynthesis deacetylase BshB1
MLDVLVIAPHPDDAELGMGGGILSMLAAGWKVGVLDLTTGEPTPHGSEEIRARETAAATACLQLPWRENLGLENRRLQSDLESRHRLAGVIRKTKPRWLFAPFWIDAHPDHTAATALIEAARFWAKLSKSDIEGEPHHPQRVFYYYCVHLKQSLTPSFVMDISEHWQTKRAAIECFQSQFITGREHLDPSFIDQLEIEAAYWGQQIGVCYGEPYASRSPIGLMGFSELI